MKYILWAVFIIFLLGLLGELFAVIVPRGDPLVVAKARRNIVGTFVITAILAGLLWWCYMD